MITLFIVLAMTAPAHPKDVRVTDLKALQAKYPKQEVSKDALVFEHLRTPTTIYKIRVLRFKAPAYFMVEGKVRLLSAASILPFLRADSDEAVDEYFRRFEPGSVQSAKGNMRTMSTVEGQETVLQEVTISVAEKGVITRSVKVLKRSAAEALPGDMMPMPE